MNSIIDTSVGVGSEPTHIRAQNHTGALTAPLEPPSGLLLVGVRLRRSRRTISFSAGTCSSQARRASSWCSVHDLELVRE